MSRVGKADYTVYMGDNISRAQREEKTGQTKRHNIFAGDLNGKADIFMNKKKQLHKQAMQTVMDQFKADGQIDDDLKARRRHIAELQETADAANSQINECRAQQEIIQKQYGISDDSQEQKDLELIRKANELTDNGKGLESLTDEEVDRLANMGELTAYQREMLNYDEVIAIQQEIVDEALADVGAEGRVVGAISRSLDGRLYDMTDAAKTKDERMLAASKALAGMLYAEAKDKIDKDMQELVEKAKEEAEKRKEQEAKLEEQKAEKAEMERTPGKSEVTHPSVSGELPDIENTQNKIIQEMKKLLEEAEMLPEDLKGIQVDKQL